MPYPNQVRVIRRSGSYVAIALGERYEYVFETSGYSTRDQAIRELNDWMLAGGYDVQSW